MAEAAKAAVELLENDGLGFNVAYEFCNNPFGHLLDDKEALLNYLDLLSVANELVLMDDCLTEMLGTIEVTRTIEVVKVVHRGKATPVVERLG